MTSSTGEPAVPADVPGPVPLSPGTVVFSVVLNWILALVLGILVGVFAGAKSYASWLSLALGVCVLASLALQLGLRSKDGLVNRLAAALAGSFVVLALIGGILWAVSA